MELQTQPARQSDYPVHERVDHGAYGNSDSWAHGHSLPIMGRPILRRIALRARGACDAWRNGLGKCWRGLLGLALGAGLDARISGSTLHRLVEQWRSADAH